MLLCQKVWLSNNEWRLEEDDAESICTADDLGIDRDHYDGDLHGASVNLENPGMAGNHTFRHVYRRYERICFLGGYGYNSQALAQVVRTELDFCDGERTSESTTWHFQAEENAEADPFPHNNPEAEAVTIEQVLEESRHVTAGLEHLEAQMRDLFYDPVMADIARDDIRAMQRQVDAVTAALRGPDGLARAATHVEPAVRILQEMRERTVPGIEDGDLGEPGPAIEEGSEDELDD